MVDDVMVYRIMHTFDESVDPSSKTGKLASTGKSKLDVLKERFLFFFPIGLFESSMKFFIEAEGNLEC